MRLSAAALNHRDLFIRHHQYPAISFTSPLLADGCGVVVAAGRSVSRRELLDAVRELLAGADPRDDPALVRLALDLDALERDVRGTPSRKAESHQ